MPKRKKGDSGRRTKKKSAEVQKVSRPKEASTKKRREATASESTKEQGKISAKSKKPKPKMQVGLSLNWKRAIHINKQIDDALVKELTPVILQMKQESTSPITVGIDSPGGSLVAVESLLSLLKSPDQDGNRTKIYMASTNRAYSAAASLLAFGDYSVAFPHSRILYHDVRYSGIEDVTSSKALGTARELERGNAAFSLRLANHIRRRLIWVYLDLIGEFDEVRNRYATFAKHFDDAFAEMLPQKEDHTVDVVAFSLALFKKLSPPVDSEIAIQALHLLSSLMQIEKIERRLSEDKPKGKKSVDLIQGISDLVTEIRGLETKEETSPKSPELESEEGLNESSRNDIKLLNEVIARRFAADKNLSISDNGLDAIIEDFSFIKDLNSHEHVNAITQMMINFPQIFFGRSIAEEMRVAKDDSERHKILAPVYPQARMLWYFIVLICRCLCRGEHFLTPGDAQLLGLVDEVLGGGPVVSRREWRKKSPDYE